MSKKNRKKPQQQETPQGWSIEKQITRLHKKGWLALAALAIAIIFGVQKLTLRPPTVVFQNAAPQKLAGPVIFEVLKPTLKVNMRLHLEGGDELPRDCLQWVISGINPCQKFIDDWNSNRVRFDVTGEATYDPGIISPVFFLSNGLGRPVEVLKMLYSIQHEYYVASSDDLRHNQEVRSLSPKQDGIVISYEDYLKIEPQKMRRFLSFAEIPQAIKGLHIRVLGKEQIKIGDAVSVLSLKRLSK